ncbi:ImmA/IrrE family metallo-endopeptidase [Komarekiella sp. 'clone 1']|uniref:ImmA/IrrE family metallo-endopeptidase n=1 Tax=Komarekiella delphini-convector SJRDD-AB1 TaxID=2593771 RepID=A0AA40SZ01_9NOST|nr:ImmA/IrrE family metallo-endopeptidase [Komarekiella delphini-convector]MBD6617899.1 ImmA/IrrE family metallo-endopeptidase [Komarekiella delphini-convector SJRDD-AB1]
MSLIQSLPPEFRQRCEAIATEQRSLLRVRAFEALSADTLAAKLGATLFTPDQVPNLEPEQLAVLLASDGWSGAIISDRPLWIVYNPRHAPTRRESNLMHEIAHVLLDHKPVGFDPVTGLPKRKQNNEDEATYLGGCLQIPKRGLLWATQRKILLPQIAVHFGASEAMVQFRSNVTDVPLKC